MRQHDDCSDSSIMTFEEERIISNKYQIQRMIGKGGMSEVFLAKDTHLDKLWAIKKIKKNVSENEEQMIINSLMTEANIMKKLDHPALPRIVDIIDEDGLIFVVMDYIPGISLSAFFENEGRASEEQIIDWGLQLASALSYLHSQNPPIIYRDMKPSNVLIKPDGKLAIIDFGIAREYKQEHSSDTAVLGTLGYAPPEQHGSRQTDIRSDIYALGMTLHHLLTGADPRKPDYIYQSARCIDETISMDVEQILDKCTALDPDDRYQNCEELIFDLNNPEMISEKVRKGLKIKLVVWLAVLVITLVSGSGTAAAYTMYSHNNNEAYERYLAAGGSHEQKIESYLEAIELFPYRPKAYSMMIDEFRQNGCFADEQSAQYTGILNQNSDGFDKSSTEYLDMIYKTGVIYFFYYTGNDASFRSRILSSRKYFQIVVENADEDYENYEISNAYMMLGDFFASYVLNTESKADAGIISEPSREDYQLLLEAVNTCLDYVDVYSGDDIAYIRMTFYREILNLINDYRQGLALNEIDKEEVLEIIDRIKTNTEKLFVTQSGTIALKEQIEELCRQYSSNLEVTYRSIR